MTLEQLRIFVAVAEREHITQAGRDLNLTQSAVSAAISALESRYATKLFDRVGRRIELTHVGRLFLTEARGVLAKAAAAEMVLTDLAGLKRGSLTLAASQTVANYWLPALIQKYRAAYPGIAVKTAIGNTQMVAEMVHEGTAHIGFVEGDVDDPNLNLSPVAEDELLLVAAPSLIKALSAKQRKTPIAALKDLSWVMREGGSGTRAVFEAALDGLGLSAKDITIQLELPSNEAVRAAVEAGAGATMLSRLVVEASLRSGTLESFPIELPKRPFSMVRHKERYVTRAEEAFVEIVEHQTKGCESLRRKS